MIILISPSKDLDFTTESPVSNTVPRLWSHSLQLLELMQKKSVNGIKKMMDISDKLAKENYDRYQKMKPEFGTENSKPALYAFSGDVYRGLDVLSMDPESIEYCSERLKMLSGLYGLLRPMDLIQPYRLEMGIQLKHKKTKNLVQFWKNKLTELLIQDIEDTNSKYLINLASNEYFEAVERDKIKIPIIHIHFRELRNGKINFLSFNAKKARGLMVRYMAENKIETLNSIQKFNIENYQFDAQLSDSTNFYFVR
ncbi:MAG: peroxide stress protein YaaA [Saprospiraceae bacterium]